MNALRRSSFLLRLAALSFLVALPGCLGSGGGSADAIGPGSGKASLFLEDAVWGRLVDVLDVSGNLVERDVLVRESVQSDGQDYELRLNPITGRETLTILHPSGSADFDAALESATTGLASLQAKGFDSPPPFTKVARNGAVQLVFSEYVDPDTVDRQTIQVLIAGANETFTSLEVRYVVKRGVGADGAPKGIVIVDPTVTALDSEELGIPANGIGFPASVDQVLANVKIRIPTTVNPFANQTQVLTNEAGNRTIGIKTNAAGDQFIEPVEYQGLDPVVVRAFRSGNPNDAFNGFMTDNIRPSLITTLETTIAQVSSLSAVVRRLTYRIDAANCRPLTPKAGDVFEVGDAILEVNAVVDGSDPEAYVVDATLLTGTLNATTSPAQGRITTRYASADFDLQLCFVEFSPEPQELPAVGVDPFATISVRFSEPMDAATLRSLDTMVLASVNLSGTGDDADRPWNADGNGEAVSDYIDRQLGYINVSTNPTSNGSGRIRFGPIAVDGDAQTFTLAPLAGMTDSFNEGANLFYNLALRDGSDGILDLAGNVVDFDAFVAGNTYQSQTISLAGAIPDDRYFALRFNGSDEDADQGAEYAGQFGPFLGDGRMRPRPVDHFPRPVDPTNPWVGQRLRFAFGLMTPLTPAGAVLMTVYPYHVMGFGLGNVDEYNLDVEGLSWSPFDGVVFDDVFDRYSIALAHSNRLPDDYIDPNSGYPQYPDSGLRRGGSTKFDENIYAFGYAPDPRDELIVFDRDYRISDINKYLNDGSYFMLPWPEFDTTYTWRDTTMPKPDGSTLKGGGGGAGAPPKVLGQPQVYPNTKIPSIGLPLLMRFRCYPRGQEFGFNGFQVQIMVGSSALPAFRVFSAGGRDGQNQWHLVRPDLPPEGVSPTGGYNTTTGATTKAFGPELYWGQVDFVTRISRVYTHWFSFGGTLASITPITVEPSPSQQLSGTSVLVEFRGTDLVDVVGCVDEADPLSSTVDFDAYGDYEGACGVVSTPGAWTSEVSDLLAENPAFFQLRFTFVSNIVQDLSPLLDAVGFAWNVAP